MGPAPSVVIREVGPRDGLQAEAPMPPVERARLVNALADAGCKRIEAVSFVSEGAVPSMAGARKVLAALALGDGVSVSALVPNETGARLALEAPVGASRRRLDELTVTVAASPAYNMLNVRRSIDESLGEIARIAKRARGVVPAVRIDAVVSCAFGSPYEGDADPDEVAALCTRLLEAGASALTLADTTGMATPRVLVELLDALEAARIDRVLLGMHFHETRGTALLNAYAALGAGIFRFDTSLGGLGGSPFADGSGGNLSTEDFVALLDDLGLRTGIDLEVLLGASQLLQSLVGHELSSRVAAAGPRTRLVPS
ncbi:MAG: hydroxymethylglutaryl-CoA lyase [Acidimicrobiales bacterium]